MMDWQIRRDKNRERGLRGNPVLSHPLVPILCVSFACDRKQIQVTFFTKKRLRCVRLPLSLDTFQPIEKSLRFVNVKVRGNIFEWHKERVSMLRDFNDGKLENENVIQAIFRAELFCTLCFIRNLGLSRDGKLFSHWFSLRFALPSAFTAIFRRIYEFCELLELPSWTH